jgi:hypothetical protein
MKQRIPFENLSTHFGFKENPSISILPKKKKMVTNELQFEANILFKLFNFQTSNFYLTFSSEAVLKRHHQR